MRICVVTYHESGEPRGPRHAVAAKKAFPDAAVTFLHYCAGSNRRPTGLQSLVELGIELRALSFPTRTSAPIELARRKLMTRLARAAYGVAGTLSEAVLGERTVGLTRTLLGMPADVYFAHNVEALMPAAKAAERYGAALVFDCMEFYSDMGDGQIESVSRAIREIEARCLPQCQILIAASEELAEAYHQKYRIERPLASYNVPPTIKKLPPKIGGNLNLYWRNSVLGFGQRGLEDILAALRLLPDDVHLYLQGHLGHDDGVELRARIERLGLARRVIILAPHPPGAGVLSAAPYDIGLCLERRGPLNHEFAVSNKIFDYHMAGLAVVTSELPGLTDVIRRSGGGALYEPGDVTALAARIEDLRSDRSRLITLQRNARAFALSAGNIDVEMGRLVARLKSGLAGMPRCASRNAGP